MSSLVFVILFIPNGIRKIELRVHQDNVRATQIYKRFGFQIEGDIKRAAMLDTEFRDEYHMGLCVD